MKSALLRLREARDSLSATERSIADYLLSHPEEAMELSIHEMAERTFSSPSTMIRMCHRIGFDGYKEFRRAVTYEMAVRKQSEEAERKEIAHSDSIEDIVEKITYKNIMSLEDTKNLLDADTLRQCVELLRKPYSHHRHHPLRQFSCVRPSRLQALYHGQRVHLPQRCHVLPHLPAQPYRYSLYRLCQQRV